MRAMGGYERDQLEYYLSVREKLKESMREKMKEADESIKKTNTAPDKFGSFFGPSQPVIAPRVIQESRSVFAQRAKSPANHKPPRGNEAEMRKYTRDYSFLLSDAQLLPPVVNDRRPAPASNHAKPEVAPPARKWLRTNNGDGQKSVPSKISMHASGKVTQPVAKNTLSAARKPASSNSQSGTCRPTSRLKRPLAQKGYQETKAVISKQALPSSRDQLKRRAPLRDEDSDGENAIKMIRQMYGYNPNKFRGEDDDDRDMEVNFNDIMKEEKRSAKLARKEDKEQLRLIQEEEKKRKLGR